MLGDFSFKTVFLIMSKVIKFILPGIRHLNLSDAVALCSNGVVISIQLAFRIFDKSLSNSFDLRPVSSTKVNFLTFFKVQFSFSGSTILLLYFSKSFGLSSLLGK